MSADRWFADAQNLKAAGDFCAQRADWRGAYRNYGSAVEYALKAIYLKNTQQTALPPQLRTSASHDLEWVSTQAGLAQEIARFVSGKRINWLVIRDWDQARRYPNAPFPAKEGKDFKLAMLNPTNGIWPWLSNLYQSN